MSEKSFNENEHPKPRFSFVSFIAFTANGR